MFRHLFSAAAAIAILAIGGLVLPGFAAAGGGVYVELRGAIDAAGLDDLSTDDVSGEIAIGGSWGAARIEASYLHLREAGASARAVGGMVMIDMGREAALSPFLGLGGGGFLEDGGFGNPFARATIGAALNLSPNLALTGAYSHLSDFGDIDRGLVLVGARLSF